MNNIEFICPLPNGVHARPAKEIELRASQFVADIKLVNKTKNKVANAKSVLSLISADILLNDECCLEFSGVDTESAHAFFTKFIADELAGIDEKIESISHTKINSKQAQVLPVFLEQSAPKLLRGTVASAGINAGKAVMIKPVDLLTLASNYSTESFNEIQTKLDLGLKTLAERLQNQLTSAEGDTDNNEARNIVEAHLKIAQDRELAVALSKHAQTMANGNNTMRTIALAYRDICGPLEASSSKYLRERALDIKDICLQLASICYGVELVTTPKIDSDTIIVSQALLTPSQLLALPKESIKGLVMGEGGTTSHTIILARSFAIPTLVGIESLTDIVVANQDLVVDAIHGVLILESNPQTETFYRLEQDKLARIEAKNAKFKHTTVTTEDNQQLDVLANIVTSEEIAGTLNVGADGIGLFRTEMLFCERAVPPSEEEQFQHYVSVIKASVGKKVVIRTLDIGGDKPCDYMGFPKEENPFLGYRAIRMYPEYLSIIESQFRALVRASCAGEVSIMVPMIANLNEIRWCHELLAKVTSDLIQEGYTIGCVKLGVMAEVPSVVYLLKQASDYIDFISIGSNDLTQYFFACDRGNQAIAHLYDHLNPAFLAFVRDIITRAQQVGIAVSLCGEMAADEKAQPLLLGAGLRQFSMAASKVASSKRRLSKLNTGQCKTLLNNVVDLESGTQVASAVEMFLNKRQALPTLDTDLVFTQRDVSSKAEAIKLLTDNLEVNERVPSAQMVEQAIWDREAVFSTALGFSVAIPHCKSSHVMHNSVSVLTLNEKIAWGDDVDVDLIIMLTVTDEGKDTHMKVFSKIARKLMHEEFRQSLKQATEPSQIIEILTNALDA
ncbi:phosphoenolpyruvate--protein phosphotransferase [Aliivibrio fischeri]|uniref:Phosphoenolpyruvate-protein phosphotransferase n=1 Tax=Aliivibrio fischeri SR5 TaxID=1088719 RepID=A0AAV3EPH0_ALIFS|nr:phosphoenolpyruvate--protein phosphotransferase [Aliivibrio fischeri]EHN68740.1 phosphoenolpyruvate-protein phosphotransferase [Aliivibrio fischeri SR5]